MAKAFLWEKNLWKLKKLSAAVPSRRNSVKGEGGVAPFTSESWGQATRFLPAAARINIKN